MRNLADDHRDGDPHPADAGAPPHDLGVERDPIEHEDPSPAPLTRLLHSPSLGKLALRPGSAVGRVSAGLDTRRTAAASTRPGNPGSRRQSKGGRPEPTATSSARRAEAV